jgi:hypothetical protein
MHDLQVLSFNINILMTEYKSIKPIEDLEKTLHFSKPVTVVNYM